MRRRDFTSGLLAAPLLMLGAAQVRAEEKTIVLSVGGMTWEGCARSVERALKETDGVIDAKVSYPNAEAWIKYDDKKVTVTKLREVINSTGFKAGQVKEAAQSAAVFELPDLDGIQINSAELKGSVVVLDFWATWCGPCLAELPTFNALHAKYAGRGVKVIGITVQSGWAEDIKPYRDKHKIAYATLIGDDDVVEKYSVIGFPTTYILDNDFSVHRKFTGKLPDRKELEREIESLLAAHWSEPYPKKGTP